MRLFALSLPIHLFICSGSFYSQLHKLMSQILPQCQLSYSCHGYIWCINIMSNCHAYISLSLSLSLSRCHGNFKKKIYIYIYIYLCMPCLISRLKCVCNVKQNLIWQTTKVMIYPPHWKKNTYICFYLKKKKKKNTTLIEQRKK